MRHVRFVSRLLNRPQLITPEAGAAVVAALMPDAELRGYVTEPVPDVASDPRSYRVGAGMAVIPAFGKLVHRGSHMDAQSGLASYQALGDMVSAALADPDVGGVLLEVDSPGGEADGALDFAEWLAAQRGRKPLWASVNQQAGSAAYALASAADRVLMGADARAGSIGVVAYHADLSRAMDQRGVAVEYIYAGDRKVDRVPTKPLSPDARARFQDEIDAIYGRFCEVVARNRGMSVESVRGTEAGYFRGREAVRFGLADAVVPHEEVIMEFAERIAPTGARTTFARAMHAMFSGGGAVALMAGGKPKGGEPEPKREEPAAPPPAPAEQPAAPRAPVHQPEPTEMPEGDEDPAKEPGVRRGPEVERQPWPHTVPPGEMPDGPKEPPPPPPPSPVGEPGALPADVPADQPRQTPPVSPVNLPAEALAVAHACDAAGFSFLIAPLLEARASMDVVRARLEDARLIAEAAAKVGHAAMAPELIRAGMSADSARRVLFAATASAADAVRTDAARNGERGAHRLPDPAAVYAKLNAPRGGVGRGN